MTSKIVLLFVITLFGASAPAQLWGAASSMDCENGKDLQVLPRKGTFMTGPQGVAYGRAVGDVIKAPFALVVDVAGLPATIWTIGNPHGLFMIWSRSNFSGWFVTRCAE